MDLFILNLTVLKVSRHSTFYDFIEKEWMIIIYPEWANILTFISWLLKYTLIFARYLLNNLLWDKYDRFMLHF